MLVLVLLPGVSFGIVGETVMAEQMPSPKPSDFREAGRPQDVLAELRALYAEAQKRLAATVLNPPGGTTIVQDFYRSRAAGLLADIERINRSLKVAAVDWASSNIGQAYLTGATQGQAVLVNAGLIPSGSAAGANTGANAGTLQGGFTRVSDRAVEVLARDSVGAMTRTTAQTLTRAADAMTEQATVAVRRLGLEGVSPAQVNRIIQQRAFIDGETRGGRGGGVSGELRRLLESVHGGTVPVTGRDGVTRHYDTKDYAELVATTRTREALTLGRHEEWADLGYDLVVIHGRVSKTFCTAFLGRVFSISGRSNKYPPLSSLPGAVGRGGSGVGTVPPFHPRCSKSTTPFIEHLASSKQAARAVDFDRRFLGLSPSEAQKAFQQLSGSGQIPTR